MPVKKQTVSVRFDGRGSVNENQKLLGWGALLLFVVWLITPEAYGREAVAWLSGWIIPHR